MLPTLLLSLPLLASLLTQATATPGVVGLQFTKVKRTVEGRSLGRRATSGTVDTPLSQTVDKNEYLVNITVGTPPQSLAVQLDTGSSDLWIPARTSQECEKGACDFGSFDETQSSSYTVVAKGAFSITYQQANDVDSGDFGTDTVTFAGGTTIKKMQFGLALTETVDTHGVMGVSYNQTESIVAQQGGQPYPNVLDQLVSGGYIQRKAFSLWLNDMNSDTGSILFGGVDTTKYDGPLVGLPTQLDPNGAITEYLVSLTSVTFTDASGTFSLSPSGLDVTALLDSGTTLTYLPNDVFTALVGAIGAVDVGGGNLVVPCSYAGSASTVDYGFGGSGGPVIHVPLAAIVGPLAVEPEHFSDPSGGCQLLIGPQNGGVILGDSFLRSVYVVYDIDNNQVAIAPAKFNVTSSSITAISAGTGLPGVSSFATATATNINPSDTSMAVAPAAVTAGETIDAGTPTVSLGAPTGGSGGGGGSSSSKGLAQPMRTGAVGAAALFGGAAAFMNM